MRSRWRNILHEIGFFVSIFVGIPAFILTVVVAVKHCVFLSGLRTTCARFWLGPAISLALVLFGQLLSCLSSRER
jgi:hypothetical protein